MWSGFCVLLGGILVIPIISTNFWVTGNMNMFSDQEQEQFSGQDVTNLVFGLDQEEIFPVAYFDINVDKLTDILAVSRDRKSINIFLAFNQPPYMRRVFDSEEDITGGEDDMKIVSVRPGDFTGDGLVDLMVTLGKDSYTCNDTEQGFNTSVKVIFCKLPTKNGLELICPGEGESKRLHMVQEPMTIDLNGDMVLDLVGETWDKDINGTYRKQRKIWLSENLKERFQWIDQDFKVKGQWANLTQDMARVSSNAFADIDGDSIPELIFLAENATLAKQNKSKAFHYVETYEIQKDPSNQTSFRLKKAPEFVSIASDYDIQIMGQPMIMDLEHNGKLHHLIPYCRDLECHSFGIYVMNKGNAIPLPLGSIEYGGFKWSFIPPEKSPSPNHNSTVDFTMKSFYSRSIVLRVGDFNLDGYPDLLGVLQPTSKTTNSKLSRAVLFENVECQPAPEYPCSYNRTFKADFDIFKDYVNVISASFYDIKENGILDVMLVTAENNSTSSKSQRFTIKAFQNNVNFDASFIKVMVLTGQPCPSCESGIPYGNVLPGATVKYSSINSQGLQENGVVAQTYRTAHMPLDLPCEIFGIGQSPNFVELLSVEIAPTAEQSYSREWLQIIPNSQVVIVPNPVASPNKWTMKLFLTPSDAVLKTFGVLVGIVLVLATLAAGLELKERREDRRARQSEAHRLVMY